MFLASGVRTGPNKIISRLDAVGRGKVWSALASEILPTALAPVNQYLRRRAQ